MRVRVRVRGNRIDDYKLPENLNEVFRPALSDESSEELLAALLDRVVEPAAVDDSYDKVAGGDDIHFLAEARVVTKAIKDALWRRSTYPLFEDERIDFV